jgi:hypothetical protein
LFCSSQQNGDGNESDTKHTFPHVYKLPQFADTLRLALASQDASAFKLRTYYRNLLISSIYDDLTRTYNLWYFILRFFLIENFSLSGIQMLDSIKLSLQHWLKLTHFLNHPPMVVK